jgi:hypothetical protein
MQSTPVLVALTCAAILIPAAAFSQQKAQGQTGGDREAKRAACRAEAAQVARSTGGKSSQANPAAAKAQIDAAFVQCMSR